jgi:hypothetical protein
LYLNNPSEAEADDLLFATWQQHVEPFLVAVGLLRERVCDAQTWASWKISDGVAAVESSGSDDSDDETPLAAVAFRPRWLLPSDKRDEIVDRIDNVFKDGLYMDDTNLPEGQPRAEQPAPA